MRYILWFLLMCQNAAAQADTIPVQHVVDPLQVVLSTRSCYLGLQDIGKTADSIFRPQEFAGSEGRIAGLTVKYHTVWNHKLWPWPHVSVPRSMTGSYYRTHVQKQQNHSTMTLQEFRKRSKLLTDPEEIKAFCDEFMGEECFEDTGYPELLHTYGGCYFILKNPRGDFFLDFANDHFEGSLEDCEQWLYNAAALNNDE